MRYLNSTPGGDSCQSISKLPVFLRTTSNSMGKGISNLLSKLNKKKINEKKENDKILQFNC